MLAALLHHAVIQRCDTASGSILCVAHGSAKCTRSRSTGTSVNASNGIHLSGNSPVHAGEMLDIHETDAADHSHSQGADKDIPCHAVNHHHCSVALQLDVPRISLNGQPPIAVRLL